MPGHDEEERKSEEKERMRKERKKEETRKLRWMERKLYSSVFCLATRLAAIKHANLEALHPPYSRQLKLLEVSRGAWLHRATTSYFQDTSLRVPPNRGVESSSGRSFACDYRHICPLSSSDGHLRRRLRMRYALPPLRLCYENKNLNAPDTNV